MSSSSTKAVLAALAGNSLIAVTKFMAAGYSLVECLREMEERRAKHEE